LQSVSFVVVDLSIAEIVSDGTELFGGIEEDAGGRDMMIWIWLG
jgi:hypothetical protein